MLKGEKNPNWKGGTSITSHGYRVIRVKGKYEYEQRLVVEKELGRKLETHERVFHKNGIKLDNYPSNLFVVVNNPHYLLDHKKKKEKIPDELNIEIECACGCGKKIKKFDKSGRERGYINGHNKLPSPTIDLIKKSLENGPKSIQEIAKLTNKTINNVQVTLCKMAKHEQVSRPKRGVVSLIVN